MKNNVVVIVGPTASGKTKLSVETALKYNGEVISADSMQIYKYMNIGTAKPTIDEMSGVPHHLIDFLEPSEEFNVVKYKELATSCIDDILSRQRLPILTGGTGFYINSVIYDEKYTETVKDNEFRDELFKEAEVHGNEFIHKKLQEVDPEAAKSIHMNNVKRVIRALEVCKFTNKKFSESNKPEQKLSKKYNFIILCLNVERNYLYERINSRVDNMIEDGLVKETKDLYEKGMLNYPTSSASIGYKELIPYLKGDVPLDEAVSKLKQSTRNYAKRQITWFKRIKESNIIDIDREDDISSILTKVYACIEKHSI